MHGIFIKKCNDEWNSCGWNGNPFLKNKKKYLKNTVLGKKKVELHLPFRDVPMSWSSMARIWSVAVIFTIYLKNSFYNEFLWNGQLLKLAWRFKIPSVKFEWGSNVCFKERKKMCYTNNGSALIEIAQNVRKFVILVGKNGALCDLVFLAKVSKLEKWWDVSVDMSVGGVWCRYAFQDFVYFYTFFFFTFIKYKIAFVVASRFQ